MPFQPTVLGQLMQAVSRGAFRKAVIGRAKWGLTDWSHLVALVAAQMAGVRSLRDLARLLAHHRPALAHLGVAEVRRSTLSDANALRPTAPFEAVAAHLSARVARLAPGLGREALRLIDATRIHAGKTVRHWAVDGAIKLHTVFDPLAQRTTCFAVTSARINDITVAKAFPIEPGATYVFDLGYYAFAFWTKLAATGCRFVTRLKCNTPVQLLRTRPIPKDAAHILDDRIGRLPERLAGSRHNPYATPVRLVTVRISTGRVLTLLTNDLTAPASEIADLYKARWEIELFFKWLKQNLRLQHFLGSSRNAITLQVLAAYRLISAALLQRRSLHQLLHPPLTLQSQPHPQLALPIPHG